MCNFTYGAGAIWGGGEGGAGSVAGEGQGGPRAPVGPTTTNAPSPHCPNWWRRVFLPPPRSGEGGGGRRQAAAVRHFGAGRRPCRAAVPGPDCGGARAPQLPTSPEVDVRG